MSGASLIATCAACPHKIDDGYRLACGLAPAATHAAWQELIAARRCPAGRFPLESPAVTIIGAAPKIVAAALGIGSAPLDVVAERIATCRACPGGHYRDGVCGALARRTGQTCGCVITLKARLASQRCPSGYWSR